MAGSDAGSRPSADRPVSSPELSRALNEARRTAESAGPAGVPEVLGRHREVAAALEALASPSSGLVVVGEPGAGKSTLAGHIAERWRERNSDGRTVRLDLADQSWQAHDAVRELLLSFGVSYDALPGDPDEQQRLLRAITAAGDLVIFDNVADARVAEEVATHLSMARYVISSGNASSSRNFTVRIAGLTAEVSNELLARYDHGLNPRDAARLIRACRGNPLAIHLSARAVQRLGADAPSLGGRSPLDFGVSRAVEHVRHQLDLPGAELRTLLTSLISAGGSADPAIAEAVWTAGHDRTGRYLRAWDDAGLLVPDPLGGLMVRPAVRVALRRDLRSAEPGPVASRLVTLAGRRVGTAATYRDGSTDLPASLVGDLVWLDRHWPVLRESAGQVFELGREPEDAAGIQVLEGLRRCAEILHRSGDLVRFDELAQTVARRTGNRPALLRALHRLALRSRSQGAGADAAEVTAEAVRVARQLGDPRLLVPELILSGKLALGRREFDRAISELEEAIHRSREAGDHDGEVDALFAASEVYRHVRNYEDAAEALGRVRVLLTEGSAPDDQAPWVRLAEAYLLLDQTDSALDVLRPFVTGDRGDDTDPVAFEVVGEALRRDGDDEPAWRALLAARAGYRARAEVSGQCRVLISLAKLARGVPRQAVALLTEALELAEGSSDGVYRIRILTTLGDVLAGVGDLAGAGQALRQSVEAARELGDARSAAVAIRSQGRLEAAAGRKDDALDLFRQSLATFERLGAEPESTEAARDLADLLIKTGRSGEAVAPLERAITTARQSSDLTGELLSLGLLAKAYAEAGMGEDAEPARTRIRRLNAMLSRQSTTSRGAGSFDVASIYRPADEDSRLVGRDLVTLLEQMSSELSDDVATELQIIGLRARIGDDDRRAGDIAGAVRQFDSVVAVASRLDDREPSHPDVKRALVTALRTRARLAIETEDPQSAARLLELAVRAARQLESITSGDPSDAAMTADLYQQLADLAMYRGDVRAAENYYRSALSLADRLSAEVPGSSNVPDRSLLHARLAETAAAAGNVRAAEDEYRQAAALADETGNVQLRGQLALRLGDVALAQGRADEAELNFRRALELSNASASEEAMADALSRLGDLFLTVDRFAEAKAYAERSLEIVGRLSAADSTNRQLRQDLARAHTRIGAIYEETHEWAAARAHYYESLAVNSALIADDPGDVVARRNLSIDHDLLGRVAAEEGDRSSGIQHFRESLTIAQALVDADPANQLLVRDLVIGFRQLGAALRTAGDHDGAVQNFRQALELARGLAEADADHRRLVSTIEAELAEARRD